MQRHPEGRRSGSKLLILLLGLLFFAGAHAYPDKPIRLVVGYAPGPGIDYIGRTVAQKLGEQTGWTVTVHNQPGAGGLIATTALKSAPPDGYTLLLATTSHITNPYVNPSAKYDPVRDFTPVGPYVNFPAVVLVGMQQPYKTARDMVAAVRKSPKDISYASFGSGSSGHLVGTFLSKELGVELQHVPYSSSMPYADVSAGLVTMVGAPSLSALNLISMGKMRAIAVASLDRVKVLPDVPTFAESGIPGFEVGVWYGVIGPPGMPESVVKRLNGALQAVFRDQAVATMVADGGGTVYPQVDAEGFTRFLDGENKKWSRVLK